MAIFLFLFSFTANAEYRAFELSISNVNDPAQGRVVVSDLDDIQYPMYFYVHQNERVKINATWMCYGRTEGFAPVCPNPKARAPASAPASP